MSEPEHYDLQIIIAAGPTEIERATLGLALALSSVSSGDTVVVFLTMRGAAWAAQHHPASETIPGFETPGHYLALLIEAGARIEACTSCVETFCVAPRGLDGHKQLHAGLERAGLSIAALRASATRTVAF